MANHMWMHEGCLKAGGSYFVGDPLPGAHELLILLLECSES